MCHTWFQIKITIKHYTAITIKTPVSTSCLSVTDDDKAKHIHSFRHRSLASPTLYTPHHAPRPSPIHQAPSQRGSFVVRAGTSFGSIQVDRHFPPTKKPRTGPRIRSMNERAAGETSAVSGCVDLLVMPFLYFLSLSLTLWFSVSDSLILCLWFSDSLSLSLYLWILILTDGKI